MEGRNVTLIVAGGPSDGHRQIYVDKTMTANELLNQENLQGYQLSLGQGKPFLAGGDKLAGLVEPGSKVYATTKAQQG